MRKHNPPQTSKNFVKVYKTYAAMIGDACKYAFNLVLTGHNKAGFYIRADCNIYQVGAINIPANAVPPSSDGISPEEAAQILVKWGDITDRPSVSPSQIDEAVLNPLIPSGVYAKQFVKSPPQEMQLLDVQKWYIVKGPYAGEYNFRLPANSLNMGSIKLSVVRFKIVYVHPHEGGSINGMEHSVMITDNTVEFVFDSESNDWILVK